MNDKPLNAPEIALLTSLADILMPATKTLPAPHAAGSYDTLLQSAIAASGISAREVRDALDALPLRLDWETVRNFAASHPAAFETLALIVSGAYVMAPAVMDSLGFPADRRNPAGAFDAAEEYETGILEPVVNRGPVYRDPRK